MSIIELLKIEFMKVKRSMILPLLLIPPILVVVSGVFSISMYMTPEYTNAWSAMFIQSALLFGYYLLPFSMVVVCVMIANRETKNNGILKMLALPISKGKFALTKFFVLLSFLAIQLLIFSLSFVIAGFINRIYSCPLFINVDIKIIYDYDSSYFVYVGNYNTV